MSFSEFSYPILQAWDWWHMYNTKGIQMQIGGADQFGNIVAGIDAVKYIAKTHHNPDVRQEKEDPKMVPFGFTVPLLTTAAGQKFGKTAGNAIWLDKEMTSCFDLYQVVDPTSLQPHSTTLTACL
jgi:tyrosyl-tRNA synthetase